MKRGRIVAGAAVVDASAEKPEKIRCKSCGVGWPCDVAMPAHVRAARRFLCSYCVGDPDWGKDGYLRDMVLDELKAPGLTTRRRNLLQLILAAPNRHHRQIATRQAFGNSADD